jgi:hypothetical protein
LRFPGRLLKAERCKQCCALDQDIGFQASAQAEHCELPFMTNSGIPALTLCIRSLIVEHTVGHAD